MYPPCTDAIDSNRTRLTGQAGNDHDVAKNSDTGKSQPAQQPIPTVSANNDRPTMALPALFFPPQQELTSQFIPGTPLGQLSASQPVLRGLEAVEAAHGSGSLQTQAPGSLALQEPGPPSCAQASMITGIPILERGNEASSVQAELDKDYRSELSTWVESAAPTGRAEHREAQRRINVYLDKPAQQGRSINLLNLGLSTLPPLPPDLKVLCVRNNRLTALPEHLPQGLQRLDVARNELTFLPKHLPQGLQELYVGVNMLTALPEHLPKGLQQLHVSANWLTALPEHMPQGLQELGVNGNKLTVLPEHMPQGLQQLNVSNNELTALPVHMPQALQTLYINNNKLTDLPVPLPQALQTLYLSNNELTALPKHLPEALRELDVSWNTLTALPEHLPQSLKTLTVSGTHLDAKTLGALMRTNTSITKLDVIGLDIDAGAKQALAAELVNNRDHPARLLKAAVTLDLLTRFGLTTFDQTGTFIKRDSTPSPVAGGLPQQFIPPELHDVLAANCPKGVLAVLAGLVDDTAQ